VREIKERLREIEKEIAVLNLSPYNALRVKDGFRDIEYALIFNTLEKVDERHDSRELSKKEDQGLPRHPST
jgi:hypothetical protein